MNDLEQAAQCLAREKLSESKKINKWALGRLSFRNAPESLRKGHRVWIESEQLTKWTI